MTNDICLRCKQRSKRKGHQFCSERCTRIAAKKAPQLLRVPKGHVMYNDGRSRFEAGFRPFELTNCVNTVKKAFGKNWRNKKVRRPTICRIYLITWTHKMRAEFDKYRYARVPHPAA